MSFTDEQLLNLVKNKDSHISLLNWKILNLMTEKECDFLEVNRTQDRIDSIKNIVASVGKKTRRSKEYSKWRQNVKNRDMFKCTECGSSDNLHTHHIKSFKEYPLLRLDVDNGITLCQSCHIAIHKKGK